MEAKRMKSGKCINGSDEENQDFNVINALNNNVNNVNKNGVNLNGFESNDAKEINQNDYSKDKLIEDKRAAAANKVQSANEIKPVDMVQSANGLLPSKNVSNGASKNAATSTPDFWRLEVVEEAASFIRNGLPEDFPSPEIGIICGSGCGTIADAVTERRAFNFRDIPHFIPTLVPGHKGLLILGQLGGKTVVVLQGRFHAYEGHHYGQAAFPVRVMGLLGAKTVVITFAAGGLNSEFRVGDFMLVKDHISIPMMAGNNPLKGPNDERLGPRFVSLNNAYDRDLRKAALETSQKLGFGSFTQEGNVMQISGPNYETPMECRFLKLIGADAVGMSNAHECSVARHMNIKVLSIALISNMCILDPDDEKKTNHEEVLETGQTRATDLKTFVEAIVSQI